MKVGADDVQPARIDHRLALGLEGLVERCLHRLVRLAQRIDRRAFVDDGGRGSHRERLVDRLERRWRHLGVGGSLLGDEGADRRIDELCLRFAETARIKVVDSRDGDAEGGAEAGAQQQPGHVSRVTAKKNVGTAARHVGGDRDGGGPAGLYGERRVERVARELSGKNGPGERRGAREGGRACAMISASRSAASAFAFSTRWGTWSSSSFSENASVDSTDVVPTSTGRPSLLIASSSCSAAFDLPRTFLYTDVGTSARAVGSTGGTSRTLSLYIVPNSSAVGWGRAFQGRPREVRACAVWCSAVLRGSSHRPR